MCDSKPLLRKSSWLSLALICCIATTAAHSSAQDYVSKAKQLFLIVDPELKSDSLVVLTDFRGISDYSVFNGFTMDLYDPESEQAKNHPPCGKPEASALFSFAAYKQDDRILRFNVSHSPATRKLDEFTALVDRHPEWSDAQVISELAKAGGKFGPDQKESLLHVVGSAGLESFIGKFEMISARFDLREQLQENSPPEALVTWSLAANTEHGDTYVIVAEPFQGRILRILRLSVRLDKDKKEK